jgi:ATP-dependent DNA ligase
LLTRSGLDWTAKYPLTAAALAKLSVKTAYIDGELCGVRSDGVTFFEVMQQASDSGGGALVYFAFDLLELDGVDVAAMQLLERKERLAAILKIRLPGLRLASTRAAMARRSESWESTFDEFNDRDRGPSVATHRALTSVVGPKHCERRWRWPSFGQREPRAACRG